MPAKGRWRKNKLALRTLTTQAGLYVHLSCMIERLVMRNEISHYKDLEQFTRQHGEFIAMVNHSFQRLKILYNPENYAGAGRRLANQYSTFHI